MTQNPNTLAALRVLLFSPCISRTLATGASYLATHCKTSSRQAFPMNRAQPTD